MSVLGASRVAHFVTALTCVLVATCATPRRDAGVLMLADGAALRGSIAVERMWIPAGATVHVEGDLDIQASGIVRIDGVLAVRDAANLGVEDAPDVRIASSLVIDVGGAIRGGRGRDGDASAPHGGDGSTLDLAAPLVRIAGEVRGGDAGDGGPAGAGGNGGSVLVDGTMQRRFDAHSYWQVAGGRGGNGGSPGGDGGEGGATISTVSEALRTRLLERGAEIQAALAADPSANSG